MTDAEFLAERRRIDGREFLINSLNAEKAPRIAPAARAIRALLAESSGWHRYAEVVAVGVRASDLAVKTVDNLLRTAVFAGLIERRGEYERGFRGRPAVDMRAYRLIDWPEHF